MPNDLSIVEKYISQKSEVAYRQLVEALGCLNTGCRGSGSKTAIIAAALAWMYRDENPAKAIEIAANLLFSDTDTIATMVGAIIGVVAPNPPSGNLLDRAYINQEAIRLHGVSIGKPQSSFPYPDLLQWQPPRTPLDVVGLIDNHLALAGLGIAQSTDKMYHNNFNNDFFWQWVELDFGQSMACIRRSKPLSLPHGSMPSKLKIS
jgi:hypothetical protein